MNLLALTLVLMLRNANNVTFNFREFLKGMCKITAFCFLVCVSIAIVCMTVEKVFGPDVWVGKAHGQTQQFIARDTMGRELGRAVTDSNGNTNFYNERGQTTGRAVTNNGTTTTYDNMGRQTGTIRSNKK